MEQVKSTMAEHVDKLATVCVCFGSLDLSRSSEARAETHLSCPPNKIKWAGTKCGRRMIGKKSYKGASRNKQVADKSHLNGEFITRNQNEDCLFFFFLPPP